MKKYFSFFAILFGHSNGSCQNSNLHGTYLSVFTDSFTCYCCQITEVLRLNPDNTFSLYRKGHYCDVTNESISFGKFELRTNWIFFTSDSVYTSKPHFFDYSGLKLKIRKAGLETIDPVVTSGTYKSAKALYKKVDFKQLDSLKLYTDYSDDSVWHHQDLIIRKNGQLLYQFSDLTNRIESKSSTRILLSIKQYAQLLKDLDKIKFYDLPTGPSVSGMHGLLYFYFQNNNFNIYTTSISEEFYDYFFKDLLKNLHP